MQAFLCDSFLRGVSELGYFNDKKWGLVFPRREMIVTYLYERCWGTTGLVVVQHGRVIYQYGDISRLSYLASARKSVLSMLYGPYVADGKINLDAALKDLRMSDIGQPPQKPPNRKIFERSGLLNTYIYVNKTITDHLS